MSPYLKALKNYWYVVVILVIIAMSASFFASIVQTPKYQSTIQLLILQKQSQLDAAAAVRSAEATGNTLAKVVYSSSFFEDVMATKFDITKKFSDDPEKRKKEWKQTIELEITSTGILKVKAFAENKKQAEQIALATAYVLVTKGNNYHGGGVETEIKMIDEPTTTNKPAKPKTLLNTIIGFFAGLFLSIGIIYLLTSPEKGIIQERKKISLFNFLEKKNKEEVLKKEIPKTNRYSSEGVDEWIKTGKFKGPSE